MSCDVGEVTDRLENEQSFIYVTAHSTLLSLLLRHRLFTHVTWRTAHDVGKFKWAWNLQCRQRIGELLVAGLTHCTLSDVSNLCHVSCIKCILFRLSTQLEYDTGPGRKINSMKSLYWTSVKSNDAYVIDRVFCPRAGPSLQTQEPRPQFCSKASLPPQTQAASRCFSHPTLSLASEQTLKGLKRFRGHQRGGEESDWALPTSPKFTTGIKYQFHQGFDHIRDPEIPITLRFRCLCNSMILNNRRPRGASG